MEGVQKAVVVALIIGIVGIVGCGNGADTGLTAEQKARQKAEVLELIDEETFEVMTNTRAEWESLGKSSGKYRNPKTKNYTMCPVDPAVLQEHGLKVPAVILTPDMPKDEAEKILMERIQKARQLGKSKGGAE